MLSSFILTLKLLQTCVNFFLLLNTKEDIVKNDCAGGDFTQCWTLALAIEDLEQTLMNVLMEINVVVSIKILF